MNREKIRSHNVDNPVGCIAIGLALGVMSSFLGIGGGPINLVVLYFFFSMDTKTAAQNSLYIILFSQIASLIFTVTCGEIPHVPVLLLLCMMCSGILGGAVGRRINKKISGHAVDKLFLGLLTVIMGICLYDIVLYL